MLFLVFSIFVKNAEVKMLKRSQITFLATLFLVLFAGWISAQPGHYTFNRFDISQGLSHNRVNCIFKDSHGFMWFGTLSGLNRYDGYNVRIFREDLRDSSSISDNDIISIAEDTKGRLWIVNGKRMNIYDPSTETFKRDPGPILSEYGFPDLPITNIYKGRSGNLWFISSLEGLYRYDSTTGKVSAFISTVSDTTSLSSNDISAVCEDQHGDLWIINRESILEKLDAGTGKITRRFYLPQVKSINARQNYDLYIDREGDVWIYFTIDPQGVFCVNPETGNIRYLQRTIGMHSLNNDIVKGVVQEDNGKVWLATDHGGINIIDKKDFSVSYILNNPDDEKSLSQNSITTIYKDNNGIIWMGTFKKGVCFFNDNILKFQTYKHLGNVSNSLSFDDVNCFTEDEKGNIWIGTNGGGLIYLIASAMVTLPINTIPTIRQASATILL